MQRQTFPPNFSHNDAHTAYGVPPPNHFAPRMPPPRFRDMNPQQPTNLPHHHRMPPPPNLPPNFTPFRRPPPPFPQQGPAYENNWFNDSGHGSGTSNSGGLQPPVVNFNIPPPMLGFDGISSEDMTNYPQNVGGISKSSNHSSKMKDHGHDSSVTKGDQEQEDLQWVQMWTASKAISIPEKSHQKPTLKISEAQNRLREALYLLNSLKSAQTMSDFAECSRIMGQLKGLEEMFTDEERVDNLVIRTQRVAKKRVRLRERRKADSMEKEYQEETRKLKHDSLDKWQESIAKKAREAKQELQLKAAADETLKEVRRKLADVSKTQECLKALIKLRQVRADRMTNQGLPPPREIESAFTERTKKLSDMLSRQHSAYEAERKSLEVMLESEQEEILQRERSIMKKKQEKESQKHEKQISTLLFGPSEPVSAEVPMFPFSQFYEAASNSEESLLCIRCEWDNFLCDPCRPGSTAIPPGWIVPSQPSSNAWAACVQPTS